MQSTVHTLVAEYTASNGMGVNAHMDDMLTSMPFLLNKVDNNSTTSAGRYQKLSNSIYCLRFIHDMNKYCLLPNSAKLS